MGRQLVQVVGYLGSPEFHRAKAVADQLTAMAARDVSCSVSALTEFDWELHLAQLVQAEGAAAAAIREQVVVSIDGVIQLSSIEFSKWAVSAHGTEVESDHAAAADAALKAYLNRPGWTFAYFDVQIGGNSAQRIIFELDSATCPNTADNFVQLCTGAAGITDDGIALTYKGSVIHRVQPGGWVQGGDIKTGAGDNGVSALTKSTFPDENFIVEHSGRGILSMANNGLHTNASQYCISLKALPWMNGRYVAFGKMITGNDALKRLEAIETSNGRPDVSCVITGCGVL